MGARSRKRRRAAGADGAPATVRRREPRVRGEARDAQIRVGIRPLAPGERPWPLRVAVGLALALALINLVLLVAGYDYSGGSDPNPLGAVIFAAVMVVAAAGMWAGRYWAVLGFQILLAIIAIAFGILLLIASNVLAALLCIVTVGLAGTLFYKLIRVLARMQVPRRPGAH